MGYNSSVRVNDIRQLPVRDFKVLSVVAERNLEPYAPQLTAHRKQWLKATVMFTSLLRNACIKLRSTQAANITHFTIRGHNYRLPHIMRVQHTIE